VIIEKTSTNPVNKKFKSRCISLIYSGSHFEDVVPPGIVPTVIRKKFTYRQ